MLIPEAIAWGVRKYAFRAYGEPSIDAGDGDETTATSSSHSNTMFFSGRKWNPEIGIYY